MHKKDAALMKDQAFNSIYFISVIISLLNSREPASRHAPTRVPLSGSSQKL